ncbi:alpha-ketoglutarate-dependent dioxygenase AlkB [Thalassotalea psychrophila]|uniref:Alpha-ketoglutarate-dependent dioxygenase AlkB n=1 Tax=Thalassotalea psychrophila TaxID=3065647 RepID=A0ABY9U023_9GAMM|nr:alpha-ketoglutarate-dependent dioxygenase AlkB [Colwelliaceae bacterium SQ149]
MKLSNMLNFPVESYCQGELLYWPSFYSNQQASELYVSCVEQLQWRQEQIKMFGKLVTIPRLQAWYGDKEAEYKYSGLPLVPLPWHKTLLTIKEHCQQQLNTHFNSVLANYYRDNNDSMGWHSDNEKQLGIQPTIASVSLGQERKFCLKHKSSGEKLNLTLQSGSLLVMQGNLQQYWQHALPKSAKPLQGRVNLTFRNIQNLESS